MLRLLPLLLAGLASLVPAQQPVPPPDDLVVIPGKRVGPVTHYSSLRILQSLFGKANVRSGKLPGYEGEVIDGATINSGTDRELQIVWKPDAIGRRIESVRVTGRAWKFANGLSVGLTVSDVATINGMPFQINGFGWDFGGFASFAGGSLERGVTVRFRPGTETYSPEIAGDRRVASTSPLMTAVKPLVSEVSVVFQHKP